MELNKEEIKNLLVFMSRTQLSGNEVSTFNQLAAKLRQELQKDSKSEESKVNKK